ncbi:MAG: hypothetical protein KDC80_17330 [Saprospiraceae bacterium]|nr:hypothetical protein [Saprospiraceae bacterium]
MILQDSELKNGFSLTTKLVERASEYVLDLLRENLSAKYVFHNQRYTVQTVHAVSIISKAEEINLHDQFALKIAAWFHHTGFIETPSNHREISAEIASDFLRSYEVDPEAIEQVAATILQSGSAWDVVSQLDMILYDADWYFLSASNFKEMLDRRKEEMIQVEGQVSRIRWVDYIEECFVQHQYLTNYGQEFLHNLRRVNYLNYKNQHQSELPQKTVLETRSNF